MSDHRYVCLSCHRGHDAPGFCPHCSRGELLDTHIASDRELLEDRIAEREDRRRGLLGVLVYLVGIFAIGLGGLFLLSRLLGWSPEVSAGISVLLSVVIMVPVLVRILGKRTQPADESPFSEIDPVQWERLVAEPVAEDGAAPEPVRRRPVQKQRT